MAVTATTILQYWCTPGSRNTIFRKNDRNPNFTAKTVFQLRIKYALLNFAKKLILRNRVFRSLIPDPPPPKRPMGSRLVASIK